MKLGVLFSGGKDSTFAAWTAKKYGHEISCLISIISKNEDSYMFHTPIKGYEYSFDYERNSWRKRNRA